MSSEITESHGPDHFFLCNLDQFQVCFRGCTPDSYTIRQKRDRKEHRKKGHGSEAELESKSSSFPNHSFHIDSDIKLVRVIRMPGKVHIESCACTVSDCA